MPKISEILRRATEILEKSDVAEPRREANSLLGFALQKDRAFLIAHNEYQLNEAEQTHFESILQRRAGREPLQHITGKQEFYGLEFEVSGDVLIPRPETELIVENALELLRGKENPRFCEVGVGSGCISVSILHEIENASAIGLEISEKAAQIALKNAERHKVLKRFELRISDVFSALTDEKFELIVSNPPYIPRAEIGNLQAEVRDFEPLNALTDGAGGLSIIQKIIKQSPHFLCVKGFLLMEIGFGQSEKVLELIDTNIWGEIEFMTDLQNIPRMLKARLMN